MAQPAAVLNILVTVNSGQASRGLNQLNTQLGSTHSQASKATAAVTSLAKGAALGAVTVGAAKAVRSFVDFDRSMRNVNSIAKLSEKNFDSLSKRVLKLAGPTAQAPKTLADGLYQLVSSGFDANQSIKILGKSAIAATAGLTDTATATTVIAAAINSYGLSAKDAGKVSDTLFQTVNIGVLTFEELAQSLGPVLPAAKSLNISLQQVGAALATLTKQGFPAAEAATAIDNAMRALLKPSNAMKQAFKDLGVAGGEELVKKYGSLQSALEAVRGTTDGSGVAMNKLFNQIRGARGAMTLTGTNAKGAAKDLRALGDASGATAKAFNEQAKSASVQWARLKAQIDVFVITVGTVLFPIVRRAIIILLAWDKILVKLPMLWITLGKVIVSACARAVGAIRGLGGVATSVFRAVRNVVVTAMDKVLGAMSGFLRGVNTATHAVPGLSRVIGGVGDRATHAADNIDHLRENIRGLKSKEITVGVKLDLRPPSGIVSGGDGWGITNAVQAMAQNAFNTGSLALPMFGGGGSAALMGANANLSPFAALGAKMGLHVSSGLRPGAITSSGNLSYHAMGRAIDMADGPAAMLAYAKLMAASFGTRLKELIHTPLGFSIKNGREVAPYAQAEHYNHVHVAMQRGGMAVPGHGSGDKVPVQAMVEPHERLFVLNRNAVPAFDAINQMFPRFQSGGMVRASKAGRNAGFRGKALQYLLAIGGAESGDYTNMIGDLAYGGSYGPWQVNHPNHPQYNTNRLQTDWTYAAKAAYQISGGGKNWSPWTMFRNGGYKSYMDEAARAIGKTSAKAKQKAKQVAKKVAKKVKPPGKIKHWPSSSAGSIFMQAFGDQIDMRQALAALTPDMADDITVAQDAVRGWRAWLDWALGRHDTEAITSAATQLKTWQDALTDLMAPVAAADDSERVGLLQQLLQQANQRTAVSQAQYGVFAGVPRVASGGSVAPQVNVQSHVSFANGMGWLEKFVDTRIEKQTRTPRSTPLPGRGGGLQR